MLVNRDPLLLHPSYRERTQDLQAGLVTERIPMRLYEGVRTPRRQADEFFKGRVPGIGTPGKHTTFSGPWVGRHQYGLAGDWVFFTHDWTWDEPEKGMWDAFHKLALQHDLEALKFEAPHVQLKGIRVSDLLAGNYPDGGDATWRNNLAAMIQEWGAESRLENGITLLGAPPLPSEPSTHIERLHWSPPPGLVYDEERGMCVPEGEVLTNPFATNPLG